MRQHVLDWIALIVLILIALVMIELALTLVWPNLCAAENTKSEYRAWLEMKKIDDVTRINLVCENLTDKDASLQFSFFIEIVGPSGRSSSRQSGTVRVKAGQKGVIARAKVSVPPGFCKVRMAVYKDGNLVAEEERTYPGQEV